MAMVISIITVVLMTAGDCNAEKVGGLDNHDGGAGDNDAVDDDADDHCGRDGRSRSGLSASWCSGVVGPSRGASHEHSFRSSFSCSEGDRSRVAL